MNKPFALAAALSALCVAGPAVGLETGSALGEMKILGTNILLSSGDGLLLPTGSEGKYCGYQMEWTNPKNKEDVLVCSLLETKPFGTSCAGASLEDIDTLVQTSPDTKCIGFSAAGAQVPTELSLIELSCGGSARLQGIAIQGPAVFPVVIKARQRYQRPTGGHK